MRGTLQRDYCDRTLSYNYDNDDTYFDTAGVLDEIEVDPSPLHSSSQYGASYDGYIARDNLSLFDTSDSRAYSQQIYQESLPLNNNYINEDYDPIQDFEYYDGSSPTPACRPRVYQSASNPTNAMSMSFLSNPMTEYDEFHTQTDNRLFERVNLHSNTHSQIGVPFKRGDNPRNGHGIRLRPVTELSDVYRAVFKFGVFNAVQSQCFDTVMKTKENMVISAPTGSGKTVLFELAIIEMLSCVTENKDGCVKCVYMAPTKALCSERYKDWRSKFEPLGIKCCEMTGDTVQFGNSAWKEVRGSTIIITTGEKWDSLTRNWQNHGELLSQIKLFMVDEVHILNESRGSTVEVVISRMKLKGLAIRFILVSATVPNINDVAEWIGNGASQSDMLSRSAKVFEFGENFRPCKLSRFVYGFPRKNQNDFQFIRTLDFKLYPILQQRSIGKPILIFCSTRKGVSGTAEQLAKEFEKAQELRQDVPWSVPKRINQNFQDKRLEKLASLGIGVHHAGLNLDDRRATEELFLSGILRVVVATSTLAVGVNLPAHTVVIKGVKIFQNNAWNEYSDLDIIQMIGRAGRPQFDKEGIAIILCEAELERKYRDLAQGETLLESCLHRNLLEHINSEVGLGTICNLGDARKWLCNSFLYQRIKMNSAYYGLDKASEQTWQERLDAMVSDAVQELSQAELVTCTGSNTEAKIMSTAYGDIMSKYYVRHSTMGRILQLPIRLAVREILEAISDAEEFGEVRLRGGDKQVYNKLKDHLDIRFKMKRVEKASDKVFVLIQAVLGGISLSAPEYKTIDSQPALDALLVFRHAARIARVVVEVAIVKKNGCQLKYGLELLRCLTAKAWEDRPIVLRQVESIGEKSVKVLAEHGINSLQMLRRQEASRIELLLNRRAPFGHEVLAFLGQLPVYALQIDEKQVQTFAGKKPVEVELKIECSLQQAVVENNRRHRNRSFGMTSILTVTSENDFIDFRRISTKVLKEPKSFNVDVQLSKPSLSVCVYVSSETIAGLNVTAIYKPAIHANQYPTLNTRPLNLIEMELEGLEELEDDPEFWNIDLEDDTCIQLDPVTATDNTFVELKKPADCKVSSSTPSRSAQLTNGNFACNHACKDKTKCRHLCCREGLTRPPPVSKRLPENRTSESRMKTPSSVTSSTLVDHFQPKNYDTSSTKQQTNHDSTMKMNIRKTDNRMQKLEALHSHADVNNYLKLPHGQRLMLDKRATVKPSPDFNMDFAVLKDAQESIYDCLDDDDDLPDSNELLLNRNHSNSERKRSSSTRYSDSEIDALIRDTPLENLDYLNMQTITQTPKKTLTNKRRIREEVTSPLVRSPTVIGSTSPPRKRIRKNEISKATALGENPLADTYQNQETLSEKSPHLPLFLPTSPSDLNSMVEKLIPDQTFFEGMDCAKDDDKDSNLTFALDESLFEIVPVTPEKVANEGATSPFSSHKKGKDMTELLKEDNLFDGPYADDLSEFEAWLASGAVEIIET